MLKELKIKNTFAIIIGTIIVAFGLVHFNIENKLAEGGLTGISLILYFVFHIKPSLSYFIMNIPLMFIGWKILGRRSFLYTIIGTASLSAWLAFFEKHYYEIPLLEDLMLAALFAGVFAGVGLGIVFRYGGTTGGIDIISRVIHKFFGISIGKIMFTFDVIVLTVSLITYLNYKEAMYTLVVVFIATRIIDFMNDGLYDARGAMIMSEHVNEIAEQIAVKMKRGVTFLRGHGYYTKTDKDVIYCVVGKNEINKLKEVITSVDVHAFVTVSVVQDVLGEGFTFDQNRNPLEK